MIIFSRMALVLSLLLFVQGCNNIPINYNERLSQLAPCCSEIEEIPVEKLLLDGKARRFHLGDEYQTVIKDDGKRVFALKLELPNFSVPYSIKIKSLAKHDIALVPKLTFIDGDNAVSRVFTSKDFIFNLSEYESTIFLNEEQKLERYLLISEDLSARLQTQHRLGVNVNTISTGSGVTFSYGTGDIKKTIHSGQGGEIEISLIEYKLTTLQDLRKNN